MIDLPLDRPRPAERSLGMRRTQRTLDHRLPAAMGLASAGAGCSLLAGLLGAFATTLYRLTGQDDIVLGLRAAGRPSNELLVLRLALHAQLRFDALMGACHAGVLEAVAQRAQARSTWPQPLASVSFDLLPDTREPLESQADADADADADLDPRLDLALRLHQSPGGLVAEARYSADLFDEASVQRWLEMFERVLCTATRNPAETVGRLELLSPEAARSLAALQPARTALAGAPLAHAAFMAHAALHPAHPAVRDGAQRCSYAELDALSNRLARALRERGVGRGQRVGLCLERGIDMLVALLAVLKSGAAYVPLDPSFPQARLDHYVQDAALSLLLTSSRAGAAADAWRADAGTRLFEIDRDTAWRNAPAHALAPGDQDARPDDAAYVIYTSGSTGKPKGVCVPHRGVANLLQSMQRAPGIGPGDRIAAVTTLSFDMAVPELLLPLAAGAEIVLVQRETAMDGRRLRDMLEAEGITILQATPGMWQLLLEAQWEGRKQGRPLRGWIGAEPVRAHLALALLERCTELWNLYGPTETTVWSTAWRMERDAVASRGVAIGTPIDNTEVWILDAQLQPCPVGVPGEICIGGDGVTLGYLERAELTAERFVHARPGTSDLRIYRTGDRGRWRNDGLLEHLGRLDFQVKVRGYRIEPGEIEARCNEHPGVSRSVVVAREDHPGDVRLVAYLALTPGATPGATLDRRALIRHLRERLPVYMLPQHVVVLDTLPTLPNGKLDRAALPPPQEVQAVQTVQVSDDAPMQEPMPPALACRPDRKAAPLAPAQERIHRKEALHPGHALHNMPSAQRLRGTLDVGRFEAALRAVIRRQPTLRTSIGIDAQSGLPLQSIAPQVHFELPVFDLRNLPADQREAELVDRMQELADRPIDIRKAPMAHAALFQLDDQDHAFVFVPHQLVWDEDSHALLWRELWMHHGRHADDADARHAPPPLATTHGDHAEWLAGAMQSPAFEAKVDFWRRRADAAPTPLPHTDLPRRAGSSGASGQGSVQPFAMAAAATQRLRDTAHALDTTLDTLALAVYALALGQATGRDTVAIAAPVRGRREPGTENVMGRFDTVAPARLALDMRQSLPQFVGQVQQELRALADHQHAPFERLVAPCPWTFSFRRAGDPAPKGTELPGRQMPLMPRGTTEDIALRLVERAHGLEGELVCNAGLYLRETGARLRERYLELLHRAADRPEAALAYIASTEGSASADYLRRLAPGDAARAAEALKPVATGTAALQRAPAGHGGAAAADTAHLARPEQAQLAQVWARVIRIEVRDIRASDNFFELGGDSLLAQRAVQQTEQLLGYRVEPQRYLFETLGQIAASSAAPGATAPSAPPARGAGLLGRALGGWLRKG